MWILFEGLKYASVLLWQLCIKLVRYCQKQNIAFSYVNIL